MKPRVFVVDDEELAVRRLVRLLEATERVEVAGEITLTRADATGYAGSFDVVIAGDHVTGSFDTANCASVSEDGFGTCH